MGAGDQTSGIEDTLTSPNAPAEGSRPSGFAPALLGRYALLNELGSGGSGRVYLAFDRELERHVAIKVLKGSPNARPEVLSTRLRREAQANALLQHPNVVSVFDVGDHDGEVFIAMEYVDGGSLAQWLKQPRKTRELLSVFVQAGGGLAAAHAKGIIHRDFKPSNVLIGSDQRVRVADFGLARGFGQYGDDDPGSPSPPVSPATLVDTSLTKTGTVVGTPAYMAPEQFRGRAVDARADQFSFCLVLAEALTRSKAPRGELTSQGWLTTDLEPRSWLRGRGLSPRLRDALVRGLSADPNSRYPSLDPILDVLRAEIGQERQRAVWTAALAAGVLALAVSLLALLLTASPCEGLDEPLAQVWNESRRRAVETRLVSASVDGRRVVGAAFDRYASGWVDARSAVCAATHVRGEQSEDLLDVRMGCLDRRLEGLRMVLAMIEAGRLDGVGSISEAVLRLESPQSCRYEPSRTGPWAPSRGALAEEARLAEERLAEVRALYVGGFAASGLKEAQKAIELAAQSAHPPTEARAYEWLGRMLERNDRFEEAVEAFEKTVLLSDATADDARRLTALIELIRLDQGTAEMAAFTDRNVERAWALLARQSGSALQKAALSAALSRLSYRRGDMVACRQHGEQAMLHLEQSPQSPLFERLQVSEELARCLERLGLRKEAAQVVADTLAIAEAKLGAVHPRVGRLHIQLSRALDFSGDRAGAKAAARRAVDISRVALGEKHSQTAEAFQALANVLFREGDFEGSSAYLERAIAVMEEVYGADSHQVGGLMSSLGLSFSRLGRFDEAHSVHERAVRVLSDSVGPAHPTTAAAVGRMGANLFQRGDCEGAIEACRRAMALLEKSDPEHARILDQIRCVAGCLLELGRHREALAPLSLGLELSERRDEPPFYTAQLEFLAARALWATGDRRRAVTLAVAARDRIAKTGLHAAFHDQLEAWLAQHD